METTTLGAQAATLSAADRRGLRAGFKPSNCNACGYSGHRQATCACAHMLSSRTKTQHVKATAARQPFL